MWNSSPLYYEKDDRQLPVLVVMHVSLLSSCSKLKFLLWILFSLSHSCTTFNACGSVKILKHQTTCDIYSGRRWFSHYFLLRLLHLPQLFPLPFWFLKIKMVKVYPDSGWRASAKPSLIVGPAWCEGAACLLSHPALSFPTFKESGTLSTPVRQRKEHFISYWK